jgi:hypothetical protein
MVHIIQPGMGHIVNYLPGRAVKFDQLCLRTNKKSVFPAITGFKDDRRLIFSADFRWGLIFYDDFRFSGCRINDGNYGSFVSAPFVQIKRILTLPSPDNDQRFMIYFIHRLCHKQPLLQRNLK